jgi:hypothetical protein
MYVKPYLREDVHTHKEQNVEEKDNQNAPRYVNGNVKDTKKYGPAVNTARATSIIIIEYLNLHIKVFCILVSRLDYRRYTREFWRGS